MPGNSCSLSPEASGCSPCAHSKLRRAGARQGLFPRWQEQVDKCHSRIVRLSMQQVRQTRGRVSSPSLLLICVV